MGLFLRDDNGRSRLQSKIQADLKERLKDRQDLDIEAPEVDPRYLEDSHQTRTIGVVISLLLVVLVVACFVWALRAAGLV
ncbi:MAG TPA: hypothetical protein VFK03_04175 [Candidatus Saccharimonadales bacterium]|nr:hypothetical protein [Candidatus Saccharimonadales bacterium]